MPVSEADRRRTLKGLTGTARRITARLLSEFDGWSAARLESLRNYAMSSAHLEALQEQPPDDTRGLHREIRANIALVKAPNL